MQWQNLALCGNVIIQTKSTLLQADEGLKFAGRASGLETEQSVWGSCLGEQNHKLDGKLQEQESICKAAREHEKRVPPSRPSSAPGIPLMGEQEVTFWVDRPIRPSDQRPTDWHEAMGHCYCVYRYGEGMHQQAHALVILSLVNIYKTVF